MKYNLSTDLNGECHIISRYISKQICLFKKKNYLLKTTKKGLWDYQLRGSYYEGSVNNMHVYVKKEKGCPRYIKKQSHDI